jgi:hypothetical protein
MFQRDFEALAAALNSTKPISMSPRTCPWWRTVQAVTEVCEASNPRFDEDRFHAACLGGK